MTVAEEELDGITRMVWESLCLPVERLPGDTPTEGVLPAFVGTISISGAWEGTVTLHCTEELARHATSVMFEMDPGSVTDAELHDAVGELTNMIGGNIKALVAQPSRLSLPSVALLGHGGETGATGQTADTGETGATGQPPLANPARRVAFACGDQPLVVAVHS